jgi:small subunit ribosomal protein S23
MPVKYIEDDIRRQFFRDHPFEAFRARSITEAGAVEDEHPTSGLQWTRLSQRGRNPSPEEYASLSRHSHAFANLCFPSTFPPPPRPLPAT